MRIRIGYPSKDDEKTMMARQRLSHPLEDLRSVVTRDDILDMQRAVRRIRIDDVLVAYILDIANETRENETLDVGVSPRGCLSLSRAAQALAFLEGRDYVLPDDIKDLAEPILSHRIICRSARMAGSEREQAIIADILERVPVPV
jgi:MoxR-like ATPase